MAKKVKVKPTVTLTCGDSLALLDKVKSESVHLGIADPPYNQGEDYDACDDKKPYAEYMEWTRNWLWEMNRVLHKHGTLWVFAPDEWVSEIDVFVRHDMRMFKRRHVVWTFTFGQAMQNNFSRSHAHILYFTKRKTKFTFNDAPVRVPSARSLVYKDSRALSKGKLPDATWMLLREQLEPFMTPDRDVWLESRICGTFKERKAWSPNQIPLPIMERIVLTTSNPGDTVLDPFVGTGSSGVAANSHGRNYVGFDLSKRCIKEAEKRIAASQR